MEFINFIQSKEEIKKLINYVDSDKFKFEKLNKLKDKILIKDHKLLKNYYNNGFFNINDDKEKEIKFKLLMILYINILKRMGILIVDLIKGYCNVLYDFNIYNIDKEKEGGDHDIIFSRLSKDINKLNEIIFGKEKLIQLIVLNRIIRILPVLGFSNISKQLTNHLIIIYNKIKNNNNDNKNNSYATKIIINDRLNFIYFEKDIEQSIPYPVNKFKYDDKLNVYEKFNCISYKIKSEIITIDDYGYLKDRNGESYIFK